MKPEIHRTVRSRRRTLALEVTREGRLVVRAPHFLSRAEIERFVKEKEAWIEKVRRRALARAAQAPPPLSKEEEARLKGLARDAFIERSCLYAARMGVTFRKIRLSAAARRWGSCGPKGDLNFNWRLIRFPSEVLDYVVVHELAHLVERNHSKRFWAKVAEFCPDYKTWKKWLKTEGF